MFVIFFFRLLSSLLLVWSLPGTYFFTNYHKRIYHIVWLIGFERVSLLSDECFADMHATTSVAATPQSKQIRRGKCRQKQNNNNNTCKNTRNQARQKWIIDAQRKCRCFVEMNTILWLFQYQGNVYDFYIYTLMCNANIVISYWVKGKSIHLDQRIYLKFSTLLLYYYMGESLLLVIAFHQTKEKLTL